MNPAAAIVHARKARLEDLSAKDNREIPPLREDIVGELTSDFAPLPVIANCGLRDVAATSEALSWSDRVMTESRGISPS
jgi:tRNA-dihydrouridine synthase A